MRSILRSAAKARGEKEEAMVVAIEVWRNVRRFMGRILLLRARKETSLCRKNRRAAFRNAALPCPIARSEVEAQAELHAARKVSTGRMQEARAVKISAGIRCVHACLCTRAPTAAVSADLVELGMVEEVEVLPAKIDARPLINRETLEDAEVEVQPTGVVEGVPPDVAKRESRRQSEGRRIVKEWAPNIREISLCESSVRVADQIGTRSGANAVAYASVVGKRRAIGHGERYAGLGDGDA